MLRYVYSFVYHYRAMISTQNICSPYSTGQVTVLNLVDKVEAATSLCEPIMIIWCEYFGPAYISDMACWILVTSAGGIIFCRFSLFSLSKSIDADKDIWGCLNYLFMNCYHMLECLDIVSAFNTSINNDFLFLEINFKKPVD